MLFAAEGGGFFSSSASGYSKGLTLLLGKKKEEKPMRVTPWSQYQLVNQETDPHLQLASGKERLVSGCASFVCFSRAAAEHESSSPLKVEPTLTQEVSPRPPAFDVSIDKNNSDEPVVGGDDDSKKKKTNVKSTLKKPEIIIPIAPPGGGSGYGNSDDQDTLCEKNYDVACQTEGRKVQWTDTIGGELFEIREFEKSEYGSDDEFDHGNQKTCSCRIM